MKNLAAVIFPVAVACFYFGETIAQADEYSDLVDSFGGVTNIIGIHQTATNNPDGTGINFWQPAFEGAPASTVALSGPHIANSDAYGNLYIADKFSHSILKVTPDGRVHTFAGTHVEGFNGDGPAPANTLQLSLPNGLFVFPDGTVYLLDPGNRRIRRVDTDGVMTTVVINPATEPGQTAGTGFDWYPSGRGLWVSQDQQLIYYTNEFAPVAPNTIAEGATVKKWTKAGGIEVVCSKVVGFRNPGNIAVNPLDGKLYVTDRAEDDGTFEAQGLFRIDGPDSRTRITGTSDFPVAAEGQLVAESFIEQPRGIAFLPNGAYFLCAHKGSNGANIWYVDTTGVLHLYIRGRKSGDIYNLTNGLHPPLDSTEYYSQARAITLAPNGNLICVTNDSGYVFMVNCVAPLPLPSDLRATRRDDDGLHLSWHGIFGRGYLVERSLELLPQNWQIIGAAGGSATALEFADTGAVALKHAFYRLAPAAPTNYGTSNAAGLLPPSPRLGPSPPKRRNSLSVRSTAPHRSAMDRK